MSFDFIARRVWPAGVRVDAGVVDARADARPEVPLLGL